MDSETSGAGANNSVNGVDTAENQDQETILSVEGLTVIRGKEQIINDASLSIRRGDLVGMVGPNGGGKSTLILAMLGLIPKKKGTVKLFGTPLEKFSGWERVAYVSQDSVQFDDTFPITVRELVGLGRVKRSNLGRRLKKGDWDAVENALVLMGIQDLAERRMGQLSGGQKQRAFVAKALVRNPELLILDEPVAGVDANALTRFYQKLSDLNSAHGITCVIVSHDLAAVFCRMSRLICVNRHVHSSRITPETDPNEVLKETYGEHFHFVFHEHTCQGEFDDE